MEDDPIMKEVEKKAKEAFDKYAMSKTNITESEFEVFLKDYYKDEKEVLSQMNVKKLFEEFSQENQASLTESEFKEAYKDLAISRMKTKDNF